VNPTFERMPVSIFEQMSQAAVRHGAVNLGQGFPDFGWPEELLAEAARLVTSGSNQYAPSRGLPALREAICGFYADRQGLDLTPDQLVVTSGAIEAIASLFFATLNPGDEAVIVAPAYDGYAPLLRRAGAVIREVALRPPSWALTAEALEAAITPKTKLLVINNPHNSAA
jgi:N-succinyldiaminopimelate aminotransferase